MIKIITCFFPVKFYIVFIILIVKLFSFIIIQDINIKYGYSVWNIYQIAALIKAQVNFRFQHSENVNNMSDKNK